MRTLYHSMLCPFSRKARILLIEKKVEHELILEPVWERRPEFLALNPMGDVPVLIEDDGFTVTGNQAVSEYIDEVAQGQILMGWATRDRAEVRRLVSWFDVKFNDEVTRNLVGEKMGKRLSGEGHPDSRAIRIGSQSLGAHLDFISLLTEERNWLAGDFFSMADITAAAHLSCLDYIGDVPWESYSEAKEWYVRIKSRPSFRPLLAERITGAPPSPHYSNLDF
jgi:glutathione S-transferase